MDDFLEQTAVRRRQGVFGLLYWLAWAAMVSLGLAGLLMLSSFIGINPETGGLAFNWPALIGAALFGGLAFLLFRLKDECRVEYDYTFTNGALDICKVLNNCRRRYLCALDTKEVMSCGPAAGPAFQKVLKTPNVKIHNWFVNRDSKLYYFYFQKKGVRHAAVMELNDDMVAVIRSKNYLPKEAWRDADGKATYAGIS